MESLGSPTKFQLDQTSGFQVLAILSGQKGVYFEIYGQNKEN
jgi:hypothetical protein